MSTDLHTSEATEWESKLLWNAPAEVLCFLSSYNCKPVCKLRDQVTCIQVGNQFTAIPFHTRAAFSGLLSGAFRLRRKNSCMSVALSAARIPSLTCQENNHAQTTHSVARFDLEWANFALQTLLCHSGLENGGRNLNVRMERMWLRW